MGISNGTCWFNMNVYIIFLLMTGLLRIAFPCSPNPNKPPRSITELTILAPIVIVATIRNISVPSDMQFYNEYSACLDVKQVIKGEPSLLPQTFCTERYGSDSLCLTHVFPGHSYVLFLNTNLKARYDSDFSAAYPASNVNIMHARRGFCNSSQMNVPGCVPPTISDIPSDLVTAKEGLDVSLPCLVSGSKPYVVQWYFKGNQDDVPINAFVRYNGSLFLRAVSSSLVGMYTCVVKNAAGMASRNTRVIVDFNRCGDVLKVNKRFHIYSPDFPGVYPPDKSCAWRFCPPKTKRLKFSFNVFQLYPFDSIIIDNECLQSLEPWRRYCGAVSPGKFVSHCKEHCVQLRLVSGTKAPNIKPFNGMNITLEPTSEKRTPRFEVWKHYCSCDFVIKGRLIKRNGWPVNSINVFALESFKEPFKKDNSYTVVYRNRDFYGCYRQLNFLNDHYFFGNRKGKLFEVKVAVPANTWRARNLERKMKKFRYKNLQCTTSK